MRNVPVMNDYSVLLCSNTRTLGFRVPGSFVVVRGLLQSHFKINPSYLSCNSEPQAADAGELPRRKHTTFKTRRKFEIKKMSSITCCVCVCHAEKCFECGGTQKNVTRILYSVVFLPSHTIFEIHEKEWIHQDCCTLHMFRICRTVILLYVYTIVKLGLSHSRRNVGWMCWRIGCWGRYLGLKGIR